MRRDNVDGEPIVYSIGPDAIDNGSGLPLLPSPDPSEPGRRILWSSQLEQGGTSGRVTVASRWKKREFTLAFTAWSRRFAYRTSTGGRPGPKTGAMPVSIWGTSMACTSRKLPVSSRPSIATRLTPDCCNACK